MVTTMKRLLLATLILVLLLALTTSVHAVRLSIYIDGQEVQTEPGQISMGAYGEVYEYFMDVPPEIINGRIFVPVRAMSYYFGAEIDWQPPNIVLGLRDKTLTLTVGSTTALSNGNEFMLESAPYIKDGRTMVPLRFVSEAFGCYVEYTNGEAHITSPSLKIDGKKVVSVQSFYRMTSGGARSECKTNICIKKLHLLMLSSCGKRIDAPEHFGVMINLDTGNYYRESLEISFMESEGLGGAIIQQYKIYSNITEIPTNDPAFGPGTGTYLGKVLIHNVTHDKWHKVTADDKLFSWIDEIYSIGSWEEIFNNIV